MYNLKWTKKFNDAAKVCVERVKERPALPYNKGKGALGQDCTQLSFRLVKEDLRPFLLLKKSAT